MARLPLALVLSLASLASLPASAQCPDLGVDLGAALSARMGLLPEAPRTDADLRLGAEIALRARARFEAGAELEALADLEEAFRLTGDADLQGMLGLSLRAAGRLPEAWLAMRGFLLDASAEAKASLEARVRAAMPELEARLGGVRLSGDLGARGQLLLDGRVVARLPLDASIAGGALYLGVGPMRLELRADGRLAQDVEVDLRAGAVASLAVDLPAVATAADLRARVGLLPVAPLPDADLGLAAELAARARATFEAGAELDALADLEAAFRISGDADLLGMLGLSLQAAGRLPEAWLRMRGFLLDASTDARARLEARVRAAMPDLEARLGGVRLSGDFGARGQLVIDGGVVARLPLDASLSGGLLFLAAGRTRITIRGEARLAVDLDVDTTIGAVTDVSVTLPPVPAGLSVGGPSIDGSVPGVAVAPPSAPGLDPWPFVVLAGSLAVVLVVGGIVASALNDTFTADLGRLDCSATPELCNPIRTNLDVTSAFEFVGYIGAAVGAIVAGTIAIVVVVTADASSSAEAPDVDLDCDGEPDPRADRAAPGLTATFAPWIADGAGGSLTLRF